MRLHLTLALASFGPAALNGIAQAQVPEDCPVPSYEQCTSDSRNASDPNQSFWSSSCGEQELAAWQTDTGLCATYVSQDLVDQAPGSERVVYLPPAARRDGNSIVTSRSAPYSYAGHYSQGLLGSYGNLSQRGLLHTLVDGLDVSSLPGRSAWAANGLNVASCDEYVYEKYYDFSLFEDTVLVAAGDARAVFDAAYAPGAIGDRALSGQEPASKSRNTQHELSWFGKYPKNIYFEFAQRYPTLPASTPYPMDPDFKERIERATPVEHDLKWHWEMSQALASQPDDLLYAMAEKQAGFAKLLALRTRVYNKWAKALKNWVDSVGSCSIEVPENQLLPSYDPYINPAGSSLVDVYGGADPTANLEPVALTALEDALNDPALQLQPGAGAEAATPGSETQQNEPGAQTQPGNAGSQTQPGGSQTMPGGSQTIPGGSLTLPGGSQTLPGSQGIPNLPSTLPGSLGLRTLSRASVLQQASVVASPVLASAQLTRAALVPTTATTRPLQTLSATMSLPSSIGSEQVALDSPSNEGDCTTLPDLRFTCSASFAAGLAMVLEYGRRVAACLPAIDAQIATSLEEARADGCLEPDSVTPCDWSPKVFVQELQEKTLEGKEESYNSCQRFTGDDFGPTSLIRTGPASGGQDMTRSSEHVDQYFKDIKAAAAAAEFPKDPATGRPIFGAKTGDSGRLGNDDFGVAYEYDVGWKLSNVENTSVRVCAAEVDMNADFEIEARVFGNSQQLVASHSYLRTDDVAGGKQVSYQASLSVLGNEVLGRPKRDSVVVPLLGGEVRFPGLHERLVKRRTLLEASAHFAIGPVPVTISAGAAGEVGVELSLDGEMQYGCANPWENPNGMNANGGAPDSLALGARGGARPYAALNAFATAAVDVVVASAGVRADLTLLNLSVPFTVGLSAGIAEGPTAQVHAATDMKLVLETLSGRISVFVDTLFGEVLDKTIFTWDGPRVVKPIVNETWDMDLRQARFNVLY